MGVKVWVVYVGDEFSKGSIDGVFSTEELAEKFVKEMNRSDRKYADIQEHEVQS